MGSRLSGFQLGSEPLGLVEGVRFDLGLDYLEGTGKDIPGGRSAGAKAEDENVPPLLRVIRPGGVSGRASVCRKACILQGSHFLLHFSPSPRHPRIIFNKRGCGEGRRTKSGTQKPLRSLAAMQQQSLFCSFTHWYSQFARVSNTHWKLDLKKSQDPGASPKVANSSTCKGQAARVHSGAPQCKTEHGRAYVLPRRGRQH